MEQKVDNVNHPNHYKSKSGLEVIEVIRAFTEDLEGLEGYYTGNVLKYMCRWKKKNGLEDLKKARVYLDWLIEKEEDKAGKESAEVSTMLSGSQERQGHDLNKKKLMLYLIAISHHIRRQCRVTILTRFGKNPKNM